MEPVGLAPQEGQFAKPRNGERAKSPDPAGTTFAGAGLAPRWNNDLCTARVDEFRAKNPPRLGPRIPPLCGPGSAFYGVLDAAGQGLTSCNSDHKKGASLPSVHLREDHLDSGKNFL